MKINITNDAVEWFKEEYELEKGSFRFFVRYGGIGGQIPGFSLGVHLEAPNDVHASYTQDETTFFVTQSDAWYFEDRDLKITLDDQLQEPAFTYQ